MQPIQSCWTLKKVDGKARLGVLSTSHGEFETPLFMPVGTQAAVKALSPADLKICQVGVILANTYHLILRPGLDIIEKAGGLHRFMNWSSGILTDSGGYQVFSLANLRKVTPEGVYFRSHLDGKLMFLGPQEAMATQRILQSDIAMVFDECPPWPCSKDDAEKSMMITLEWAKICRDQPRAKGQKVFGIVQGSVYPELRGSCARELVNMGFDGYAIGGVSVGEPERLMYEVIEMTVPFLPEGQPRYLMGVGTPPQLVEAVNRGVDMFDCVLPTRVGRNGAAYTYDGMMQVKSARYKDDFRPIMEDCGCYACQNFSRAYIRHLIKAKELLGLYLLSLHNVYFYQRIMQEIRETIRLGKFAEYHEQFLRRYQPPQRDRDNSEL